MLNPVTYHFPREDELFVHQPYTDIAREATAASIKARSRINGQAAAILLLSGIVIFSLGIGIAAIVDRGHSNIKTWVASHEPV